jgi:hypothetical protein
VDLVKVGLVDSTLVDSGFEAMAKVGVVIWADVLIVGIETRV